MSRFADTFFYLAILNPNDAAHAEAQRLSRSVRGRIVTTAFALTELADGLSRPPARQAYLRLVTVLESDPRVQIIAASETLFRKGPPCTPPGRTRNGPSPTASPSSS